MKCPNCGTEGAYHGFSVIECTNEKCKYYKEEKKEEIKIVFDRVEVEPDVLTDLGLIGSDSDDDSDDPFPLNDQNDSTLP